MWKPNWGYDTLGLHKLTSTSMAIVSAFLAFQPSRLTQLNPTVSFNFPRPLQTRSFAIVGRCKKDINYLCNRRPNVIFPPMKCLALMERGVSSTAHWIRDILCPEKLSIEAAFTTSTNQLLVLAGKYQQVYWIAKEKTDQEDEVEMLTRQKRLDGLAGNVKKAESITKEADKQALLKQAALVDVLDGWKDGILTIGTFGLDPLIPFNQENDQYFILESDEEGQEEEDEGKEEEREIEQYSVDDDYYYDDNVEDEEVNPLIYATFDHSFEEIGSDSLHYDVITNSTTIAEHEQWKNKGERITLAELFLEDSDMKRKPDSVEVETEPGNKKPVARAKSGLSFAKKLIRPHFVEDSRPIKKFNQVKVGGRERDEAGLPVIMVAIINRVLPYELSVTI
ncbi:hypothetical protein POTOM_010606 [Populus tomentosa]|uniref:Protein TILLER ANGLE CONTROL 1 n=1 Tax=Populus tomentosa TaxID=118781 RepID=A0A8X8DAV7_POPTO|nr:hypothetical protein POTOM_010606 [Populus tomentosa]